VLTLSLLCRFSLIYSPLSCTARSIPHIFEKDERLRAISANPQAGHLCAAVTLPTHRYILHTYSAAKFFNVLVESFIQFTIGWDSAKKGPRDNGDLPAGGIFGKPRSVAFPVIV
jgi:hypothetical protein